MKPGKLSFSAFTREAAEVLHKGFQTAYQAGFPAISFKGTWVRRRFVIGGVRVTTSVFERESNPLTETLTLPTIVSPTELAHAFRNFGATVELLCREHRRGRFDAVVSATDGDRHLVQQYHDEALCGHRAAPWLEDHELGLLADQVQMCFACVCASNQRRKTQNGALDN